METTEDLKIGQVVKSKAGRDKGKIFIIQEVLDSKYVLICDGELRKVSKPKMKKVKHLIAYNTVLKEFAEKINRNEKINNAFLRRLLEPFTNEM